MYDEVKEELVQEMNPLRNQWMGRYMSLVVPDTDDFLLYCAECGVEYPSDCPVHGPLLVVQDKEVPQFVKQNEDPNYCYLTLPEGLVIKPSNTDKAVLGVFATAHFRARTRFGPFKGIHEKNEDRARISGSSWQLYRDGMPSHFVDARDPRHSNWMRFVNCARREFDQCLIAYQHRGEIYYRAHRDISPGMELLIYYGDNYARELNVPLQKGHDFKYQDKPRPADVPVPGNPKFGDKTNYSKPDYSPFFYGLYASKMATHYPSPHGNESKVQDAMPSHPGSKERKKNLPPLQQEGNHTPNIDVGRNNSEEETTVPKKMKKSHTKSRWNAQEETCLKDAFCKHIEARMNPSAIEIRQAQQDFSCLNERSIAVIRSKVNNIILGKCKLNFRSGPEGKSSDDNLLRNSKMFISPFLTLNSDEAEIDALILKMKETSQHSSGFDEGLRGSGEALAQTTKKTSGGKMSLSLGVNRNKISRKRWNTQEETSLKAAFFKHIAAKNNPSATEIRQAQQNFPCLNERSIAVIKSKVNNVILGKSRLV